MEDPIDPIDIIDTADEGVGNELDTAKAEGMEGEEVKKMEAEAAEVSETISNLKKVSNFLENFVIPENLKVFIKFVVENAAAAATFYGTTILLNKLFGSKGASPSDRAAAKTKCTKIKALSNIIKELTDISKTLTTWMKDHQNDIITLAGVQVPLIDIFTKYTTEIGKDVDKALKVAKAMTTVKDGKKRLKVPTTGQVSDVMTAADAFITAFEGLVQFADEKKAEFQNLRSFPLSKSDVDEIRGKYYVLKNLPY